ncbi:DUF4489 domain-containing protein [Alkalibaculum sp. M08DMB]|uniref:DUF4489 domain-containing protein n=1 Tax=Alkalibaculum sporogenes TaxID=2655001 RepID=A0A6A7KAY7_9FIRM|nr:DUF4489 domain-containing protein [Alkalibaculum sporogenes]MPW26709.1 DUF4489 domain-containing protein [Alkalibaculum sporogenes]
MNSRSNYRDDFDPCRQQHFDPCKQKKQVDKSCPTIIKCGAAGAVTIPLATVVGTTFTPTSLSLNTDCICNPVVKLEFTSNIVATAFTGTISFQIFKQCTNQFTPVPIGPAFTYDRLVAITESDTFTFFVCDCDSCHNDCCTYTVVVTVNAVTVGVLNINNATLGAIATCQTSGCC